MNLRISFACLALILVCASSLSLASKPELAVLSDVPAIEFSTSGWSYTNTSNPFLLTPDYLTNAMIGVSRLKPGQPLLKGGPIITEALTTSEVRETLAARLADKTDLKLETLSIAGHDVVHAVYVQPEKNGEEYAFILNGFVIHVLLLAKPGKYYEEGSRVAAEVVATLRLR